MAQVKRIPERTPDNYTIGVPKIFFSPIPISGNFQTWVDWMALTNAAYGVTDNYGYVKNTYDQPVGTAKEILAKCFLGTIDAPNVGGDIETLEHTVCNMGYEEVDRVVTLDRPLQYNFGFDEPDLLNLSRYFVMKDTNLNMSLKQLQVTGTTFRGSNTDAVTIVDFAIGNPDNALQAVRALWVSNGATGEPPNGTYGFIIGGNNTTDCVGAWENKRNWIAYTDLDFTADTIGTWLYLRPKGTAASDLYGADTLIDINNGVHSIPDSDPVVSQCSGNFEWNINAARSFNGFSFVRSDEGFYGFGVVGTKTAFKSTYGCALVLMKTEIGRSYMHIIPRCNMMPEGSMAYSADDWIRGNFTLTVQRDNNAVFQDRINTDIPFGYIQVNDETLTI